jgi:hypothetical protein
MEDHELLDPTLEPNQLLYRLFHENGVVLVFFFLGIRVFVLRLLVVCQVVIVRDVLDHDRVSSLVLCCVFRLVVVIGFGG